MLYTWAVEDSSLFVGPKTFPIQEEVIALLLTWAGEDSSLFVRPKTLPIQKGTIVIASKTVFPPFFGVEGVLCLMVCGY